LGEKDVTVMAWAGDGGTYDIGLQALSGAAERDENILYVCYDNEAYMNTGIQRSGATPIGAWTTTTPRGAVKEEFKKNIEAIMLAHNIPYFATANVAYPDDFIHKFKKAREIEGTRFIRVFAPCPPGWRIDVSQTVRIARLATLAKVFPLYEVDKGRYTITHYPEREIPVKDYVSPQGRFQMSEDVLARSQTLIDRKWRQLQRMVNEDYAKQIWSVWRA
jgi:pyruvate/2-oxoacid:ferredoxin oxidoreductase beta subunit